MSVTLSVVSFKSHRQPLEVPETATEGDIKAIIAHHCRISKQDFSLKFEMPFQTTVKDSGLADGAQVRLIFVYAANSPSYQKMLRYMKKGFAAANNKQQLKSAVSETKQHVTHESNKISTQIDAMQNDIKILITGQKAEKEESHDEEPQRAEKEESQKAEKE